MTARTKAVRWLLAILATAALGPSLAQGRAAQRAALGAQDAELNRAFRAALEQAGTLGRGELQAAQRKWIQARNELCAVTPQEAASAAWPANLRRETGDCVLRVTQNRIDALRQFKPAAGVDAFADTAQLVPVAEITFPVGRTVGKYYAEFEIQRELLARTGDDTLHVGVDNVDAFYSVSGDARLPPEGPREVIGLAVDLDEGRLWYRTESHSTAGAGQPLAEGTKPFALKVRGGEDLHLLLARGWVRINHGQKPFHYELPAGYRAWYVPGGEDEDPIRWIVPPYERVAGRDRHQLAMAYWTWLMGRGPAENPTLDRTGALCGQGQGNGVWFLAGGAAEDRIERRCTVTSGTQIVVPVIAFVLDFTDLQDCQSNAKVASLAPYTFQDAWLEIDGRRFDRLQDYSANVSTCPPLVIAGKKLSAQANWLGLWVALRPLPRGEHVITFGGRFNAMNKDRKVTYRLVVE